MCFLPRHYGTQRADQINAAYQVLLHRSDGDLFL